MAKAFIVVPAAYACQTVYIGENRIETDYRSSLQWRNIGYYGRMDITKKNFLLYLGFIQKAIAK